MSRSGETFVGHDGHLWELSPWMPGEADYDRSPLPVKLAAAMAALARFHKATADFPRSPTSPGSAAAAAVSKRLARLHELQAGGIAALDQAIDESVWRDLAALARQFVSVLPKAVPRVLAIVGPLAGVALPLQPCLRDIWHDHVLFTGDEVTGIIDFGAMDVDTPATDVARLLGSLVGDDAAGWQTGLAAYSASCGHCRPTKCKPSRRLDTSGTLLAGCNWIRWIYAIDDAKFENQRLQGDRTVSTGILAMSGSWHSVAQCSYCNVRFVAHSRHGVPWHSRPASSACCESARPVMRNTAFADRRRDRDDRRLARARPWQIGPIHRRTSIVGTSLKCGTR